MQAHPKRNYPGVIAAFLTVLLAVSWMFLSPTKLGGQADYVIVTGNSMEPLYHQGDLVVIRYSDQVNVGDIFAYRYPKLGQVIHRVVGKEGEQYIFKGDNNGWIDGYKPSAEDLIGKAIFHLNGAGKWVLWLRNPIRFAGIVAILAGLVVFGAVIDSSPNKGRKMNKKQVFTGMQIPNLSSYMAKERGAYIFAFALLLFASIALGLFAFVTPSTKTVEDNIDFNNLADFSYVTLSSPRVYNKGLVVSGDPVFTDLNCVVKMGMKYSLRSSEPTEISGSYKARVVVNEPTGWNRTLTLTDDIPFQGSSFEMSTYLNVCAVQKMIEAVNELAGLNQPFYTVSVITDITASGSIGGRPYKDTLAPSLDFSFSNNELFLNQGDPERPNPLHWEQQGMVPGEKEIINQLSIFGLRIPVPSARIMAVVGAIIAVIGLLLITIQTYLNTKTDELAAIHTKYASRLIKVNSARSETGLAAKNIIDVLTMDDLVRLAQSSDQFIFEEEDGDNHHFLVLSDSGTYRFTVSTSSVESPTSQENVAQGDDVSDIPAKEATEREQHKDDDEMDKP